MVIKKGGSMIIDETCTNEVEYDAATAVDPAQADTTIMNGSDHAGIRRMGYQLLFSQRVEAIMTDSVSKPDV